MKRTTRLIPRNDAELHALVYRAMEEPLAEALRRFADRAAKGMLTKIENILNAAGWFDLNRADVLVRPAPIEAVREIERMAEACPDAVRRRILRRLYGQIGTQSLTVRKAIRDVTEFGHYEVSMDLYRKGNRILRDLSEEAYVRGEYDVQKAVGIGWEVEAPGTKELDAFVKGAWKRNGVTAYLAPIGKKVQEQVEQSLVLGESPHKMASRMREVSDMNRVRAERNARTITTAVSNEAHADAYRRHGVERYEFQCTFDERTCPVCGSLDGKAFAVKDRRAGVNYPPMHPNCRCTTIAYFTKEQKEEFHLNRAVWKGGEKEVLPIGMTYGQWAETHL